MDIKSKYLKDETGEVISSVVSTQTVYDASGNTFRGGYCTYCGNTSLCR